MAPDKNRITELTLKYVRQELSLEEEVELNEWLDASPINRERFEERIRVENILAGIALRQQAEEEAPAFDVVMGERVDGTGGTDGTMPTHKRVVFLNRGWGRLVAAASVLVIVIGGTLLWNMHGTRPTPQTVAAKAPADLLPGGNRAMLTLANGATILLDSAANGTIAQQGGSKVLKIGSGELAYNNNKSGAAVEGFNVITTPRGGQYHVLLPDGTNVWLNAGSSLRFPTAFTGGSRAVELKGEGYFEVKHMDGQPFKVKVGDQEVEDIGTHFDIEAYNDEPAMKTTLLEGSVKVGAVVLKPGQQVRIDGGGKVSLLRNVNVEEAVAWKNGLFEFNGADIETVMRSMARWYDVDVHYEAQMDSHRFTGQIGRDSKASEALEILATSGYHFKIEGRTITVLP